MATFEIYDAAGSGFSMPASSANGYIIGSSADTSGELLYDDGSTAYFSISGNSKIDSFLINYSIQGDTVRIYDLEYYNNDDVVLQMIGINLIGSVSDLSTGSIFYAEVNLYDDYFGGNNYSDIIHGGPGNDTIDGYGAGDALYGDNGDDYVSGDDGDDLISGGSGADLIDGLAGSDELWGGSGFDTFCFGRGYGQDTVMDLSLAEGDGLFIDRSLAKNFAKLKKMAEKYSGGTVIDFKGADDLYLEYIKIKQLKKIDIDFFNF